MRTLFDTKLSVPEQRWMGTTCRKTKSRAILRSVSRILLTGQLCNLLKNNAHYVCLRNILFIMLYPHSHHMSLPLSHGWSAVSIWNQFDYVWPFHNEDGLLVNFLRACISLDWMYSLTMILCTVYCCVLLQFCYLSIQHSLHCFYGKGILLL